MQDIAGAIREKTGGTAAMKPGQMAAAIRGIPTGLQIKGEIVQGTIRETDVVYAGDFVTLYPQYLTGHLKSKQYNEAINSFALHLDGARIFLAQVVSSNGNPELYSTILTCTATGWVSGAPVCVVDSYADGEGLFAVKLNENKVAVLYSTSSGGTKCSIQIIHGTGISAENGMNNAYVSSYGGFSGSSGLSLKKAIAVSETTLMIFYGDGYFDTVIQRFVLPDENGTALEGGIFTLEKRGLVDAEMIDGNNALMVFENNSSPEICVVSVESDAVKVSSSCYLSGSMVVNISQLVRLDDGTFFLVYEETGGLMGEKFAVSRYLDGTEWLVENAGNQSMGIVVYSNHGTHIGKLPDGRVCVATERYPGYFQTRIVHPDDFSVEQDHHEGHEINDYSEISNLLIAGDLGLFAVTKSRANQMTPADIIQWRYYEIGTFSGGLYGIAAGNGFGSSHDFIDVYVP